MAEEKAHPPLSAVAPGTSGRLLDSGLRAFLGKFFSNLDDGICCATEALPSPLWAFLAGGYSRSQVSMRERFLQVFEEMGDGKSLQRLAEHALAEQDRSDAPLGAALHKASRFMEKWAVEYGHNSLKDGAVDRFVVEGVSQVLTKHLESSPLGAYQEKSTRYLDFSRDEVFLPPALAEGAVGKDVRSATHLCMETYRNLLPRIESHHRGSLDRSAFRTEAAWARTARARAFDDARGLLPLSVRTSLGISLPSRETERLLSELLASPLHEAREVGRRMHEEAVRINPGLLRHVGPHPFLVRQSPSAEALVQIAPLESGSLPRPGVSLVWSSPDIESLALASLAGATGTVHGRLDLLVEQVRRTAPPARARLAESLLGARGPHDDWPRELAVGQLGFEVVVDFGAFRDLQRHRVGMQWRAIPRADLGHTVPASLLLPGMEDAHDQYNLALDSMALAWKVVRADQPHEAAYATCMAHHTRWTYACDLRQWAYLVELRSGPSGHAAYRKVAHEMARAVLPMIPSLAHFVRVDWTDCEIADRRVAEERTQARLTALETTH